MSYLYTQFAVYGVGSGNAPALALERRTPNDGFFIILNLMSYTQNQGTPVPAASVASDGIHRPKMGDIQTLPISANTRKWLSVLDAAYTLYAAFNKAPTESIPKRGDPYCEVNRSLDVIISTLETFFLHYSLMSDLDQNCNH